MRESRAEFYLELSLPLLALALALALALSLPQSSLARVDMTHASTSVIK
jgi:hypothetical protein